MVDPARGADERLVVVPRDVAAERSLPRRPRPLGEHADHLAVLDGLPRADGQLGHHAVAVRGDLVLHLHRLDDAEHAAGFDDLPLLDADGEHGALHRADHRGASAGARAARALRPRAGELGPRRLGLEHGHVVAAAVDLDVVAASVEPPAGATADLVAPSHVLGGPARELVRLDHAVARLARDEARVLEQRLVEAEERLDTFDLELAERAQHPPPRVFPVDVAHDELRDHRVVERRDLAAFLHARVDADARAGRLAVVRDSARRREEALRDVLRVDPALDRVTAQLDVLLAQRERLALRDPHLLAHEVEAGHLLGHGVLDLEAGCSSP